MAAHWVGTRIRIPMLRTTAAVLALGFLSAPAMAGEFFSGTRSDSSRYDTTRVTSGHESLKATRKFESKIKGSSHKHFINVSASAENARMGGRTFGFIEGDSEFNGDVIATGNGILGAGGGSLGEGGLGAVGNLGGIAANASLGSEVDGMIGTGGESYLDGSLQANVEWGSARTKFKQSERGDSVYKMSGTFSEVTTEDGNRSSGGSIYSIN